MGVAFGWRAGPSWSICVELVVSGRKHLKKGHQRLDRAQVVDPCDNCLPVPGERALGILP
eukprot:6401643-Prorocentrum_lima.AAC.1